MSVSIRKTASGYVVRIVDQDGQQQVRGFTTLEAAKAWAMANWPEHQAGVA